MIVCTKKAVEQLGSKIENPARASNLGKILAESHISALTPDEKRKICGRIFDELCAMAKKYPFKIAIKASTGDYSRRRADFPEGQECFYSTLSVILYTETVGSNIGDRVSIFGLAGNESYPLSELPKLLDHVETQFRNRYWVKLVDDIMNLKGSHQCHSVHIGEQGTGSHGLPDAEIRIFPESRMIAVRVKPEYRRLAKVFTFNLESISVAMNFAADCAIAFQNRRDDNPRIFDETQAFKAAAGFAYAMTGD